MPLTLTKSSPFCDMKAIRRTFVRCAVMWRARWQAERRSALTDLRGMEARAVATLLREAVEAYRQVAVRLQCGCHKERSTMAAAGSGCAGLPLYQQSCSQPARPFERYYPGSEVGNMWGFFLPFHAPRAAGVLTVCSSATVRHTPIASPTATGKCCNSGRTPGPRYFRRT